MSEMVERVARAICNKNCASIGGADRRFLALRFDANGNPLNELGPPHWTFHVNDANTAIAAMREPTEAMLVAGEDAPDGVTGFEIAANYWRAMIDAALRDEG